MCLQTTKQTVQINFSELTRNPQHQPVFDINNTIRTQFSRYNNIGDMHNPPAWSIGRIQSSKTATLLNNHKSTHLSVIPPQNGKITIKTESLQNITIRLLLKTCLYFNSQSTIFPLITITITSNSFNENTNNSIEGNIPLFSANTNTQQYLNEFAVSFGPLSDHALTNKKYLVNDATHTPSPSKKTCISTS